MAKTGWEHAFDSAAAEKRKKIEEALIVLFDALARSLADHKTLKRTREHVKKHYGQDLDAERPWRDIVNLCIHRCAEVGDEFEQVPLPSDVPEALHELRHGLDLIRKWTGHDSPDNKKLREAVEQIEREPDDLKAHDLFMELWNLEDGPTSTGHYAALGRELHELLAAAGVPSAPRHAAWVIAWQLGDNEGLKAQLAELDKQIDAEENDAVYRKKVLRSFGHDAFGTKEYFAEIKDPKLREALSSKEWNEKHASGQLEKEVDAVAERLKRLKEERSGLQRWMKPSEAVIKKSAHRTAAKKK